MNEKIFLVISGIDGSGKTTIIEVLKVALEERGLRTHYAWMRYTHFFAKIMHAFARVASLTRPYDTNGDRVWRHEFYRSRLFCSLYIPITLLDTWLGRVRLQWILRGKPVDVVICDRWVNDILIDLSVDTRRISFLSSNWAKHFRAVLPIKSHSFIIVRPKPKIVAARPECNEDPDFEFRLEAYKRLERELQPANVINNISTVEDAASKIVSELERLHGMRINPA